MTRLTRLRALAALGPGNLARVGLYRIGLRTGLHPVQRISAEVPDGPYFRAPSQALDLPPSIDRWDDQLWWFDWKAVPHDGAPPDWFSHPFGSEFGQEFDCPWWQIPDFGGGDIKNVWELSRLGWAVAMATQIAHGDMAALDRLNEWLESWMQANPPYRGPNWKCGQEASIRVMHLVLAAMVLGQDRQALPALVAMVEAHMRRIAPTVSYAIGQQNNHGTSEAAALFIGGSFLTANGSARGRRWANRGRRLLEERAHTLIEPDGSFSQYSVNYHRLMLDAYSLAEAWRRKQQLPRFSRACENRLHAATDWLDAMVDRVTGNAPNIGANDGARIIPLTDTDYRDFRPTLQFASALWRNSRALAETGPWDSTLRWMGLPQPTTLAGAPASRSFDDGGFHVLRAGSALAVMRYPRFRFRPSQADALHFDLWVSGRNLLSDGGTYSYNDPEGLGDFLTGTAAHNTIAFDGRDQMPRLGRFLFGDWLQARDVQSVHIGTTDVRAAAAYRDAQGALHHREVQLTEKGFVCIDHIGGRFDTARLHWRLLPGRYVLEDGAIKGQHLELAFTVAGGRCSVELQQTSQSSRYHHCRQTPAAIVTVAGPCSITTVGRFLDDEGRLPFTRE